MRAVGRQRAVQPRSCPGRERDNTRNHPHLASSASQAGCVIASAGDHGSAHTFAHRRGGHGLGRGFRLLASSRGLPPPRLPPGLPPPRSAGPPAGALTACRLSSPRPRLCSLGTGPPGRGELGARPAARQGQASACLAPRALWSSPASAPPRWSSRRHSS